MKNDGRIRLLAEMDEFANQLDSNLRKEEIGTGGKETLKLSKEIDRLIFSYITET